MATPTANITSGRPYPEFVTETVNTTTFVANTVFVTSSQSVTVINFIPPPFADVCSFNTTVGY